MQLKYKKVAFKTINQFIFVAFNYIFKDVKVLKYLFVNKKNKKILLYLTTFVLMNLKCSCFKYVICQFQISVHFWCII